jgi:hypothetical protein
MPNLFLVFDFLEKIGVAVEDENAYLLPFQSALWKRSLLCVLNLGCDSSHFEAVNKRTSKLIKFHIRTQMGNMTAEPDLIIFHSVLS